MSTPQVAELIPSHRFGALLAEKRQAEGRDLEDLAQQSGFQFTAGELESIESGRLQVPETAVPVLSGLYGVPFGEVVPHRAKLCLDLHARYLRVAHIETKLDTISQKAILDRYLSLLYLVRGIEPGSEQIPLRGDDLAILEASLRERSELLEEQLLAAMATNDPGLKALLDRLKKKLWVPGAGLLVGSVGIGALVFAASADDSTDVVSGIGGGDLEANSLVIDEMGLQDPIGFVLPEGISFGDNDQTVMPTTSTSSSTTSTASSSVPSRAGANSALFTTLSAKGAIGTGVDENVVADAIALIGFDVESTLPDWDVKFLGPKEGFRGLTFTNDKQIELYVRSGDTPEFLAGVLAHELGHAYDLTYLDDDARRSWMDVRGFDQWWVGANLTDFAAGQGDFAEAFAFAVSGDQMHPGAHGEVTENQGDVLLEMLQYLK